MLYRIPGLCPCLARVSLSSPPFKNLPGASLKVQVSADNIRRVPACAIGAFMADAFRACGLPSADAAIVASAMLDADLSGSDAHGVFRLPGYVRNLRRGNVNPRAELRVIERAPATALLDGDNGMGHLVMTHAAKLAVEIAREAGVAWVGVRRSNHAGAGS